mmetsp:Transcript_27648/g.38890  ORF Transcript_27648/g.38890 Transcript_27648/m.38890 type:complete len:285 (+) Transcript_27648:94-948(+)
MGLFERFRNGDENLETMVQDEINIILEEPDLRTGKQLMGAIIFFSTLFTLRLLSNSRIQALQGEHVLKISALNDVSLLKEVFLAYLNAAILEPILAIGGMEEVAGTELMMNILMLGSICWWIWLITDAFDFEDVTQHFKYYVELRGEVEKDSKRYHWMRFKEKDEDAALERQVLVGSVRRDVALWFVLACILAAWLPGPVTHRDVMHAYVVLFFWIITHHACRRATAWTSGYFVTLLFPSTAIMPLEYCLPLMDVADTVEDLDFVERYREFVIERTGAELIIES